MTSKRQVTIPVAVKLGPFYTALGHLARRVAAAGAKGLVLFNRFYQPDIDLESLDVLPRVELSDPRELRLPLRWLAILRPRLPDTALAATTGVHSGLDAAKALLVGADVTMMASALLRHGPAHVGRVRRELVAWMDGHGYASVADLRGEVAHAATDPARFERANYLRTLASYRPHHMIT